MPRATAEQVNNSCINIENEEWRDVVGYEGIYQISNLGRVKHIPTTIVELTNSGEVISTRQTREYILKQSLNKFEYPVVGLVKGDKVNSIGVHRLIAAAFVPKLPDQTEVHHIDRNRQNNSVSNLKWLTPDEHKQHHRTRPDYGKRSRFPEP